MTVMKRNKSGRYSDRLSRSKEPWERGRGAPKKGNPSYKPGMSKGRKVYRVRKKSGGILDYFNELGKKF